MPTDEQLRHADKLNHVRELARSFHRNPRQAAETIARAASLSQYINPFIDWLYGIALALAILKDILDFVGIGSLPVIGTVVTFIVSFTIGLIMFITGSGMTRRIARSIVKRYGALVLGSIIEMIFGIDFLPIETLIVIVVFYLTLKERSEEARKKAEQESAESAGMLVAEV